MANMNNIVLDATMGGKSLIDAMVGRRPLGTNVVLEAVLVGRTMHTKYDGALIVKMMSISRQFGGKKSAIEIDSSIWRGRNRQ
jgi:hypothetical protein